MNLRKPLMAGLLTGLMAASGLAAAEVQAKASPQTVSKVNKVPTAVAQADKTTSNLRCWQYGQLLFEKTHLNERALKAEKPMLVFNGKSAEQPSELYLIEMGTATCLYEKI